MISSTWRQELAPVVGILSVYVLFLSVVPPVGEFPTVDDFDYAATAWHLAETGQLCLSDWPAMTLIGHVAWGSLFAVVGGSSFFVLRLSMFCISALTALSLYIWTRRCGHSRSLSTWFAVTFAVNPLSVSLQYTFMTDLSGVALAALLLLLAPRLKTASLKQCLGYGVLGGMAYLTRETAAIPFVVYCGLVALQAYRKECGIGPLFWLLAPFTMMVAGYWMWLQLVNGVPDNRMNSMIQIGSPSHLMARIYRVSSMLALRVLPVSVLLLFRQHLLRDRKAWLLAIIFVTGLAGMAFSVSGEIPIPFGGDIFDLGLRVPELPSATPPASMRGPEIHWGEHPLSVFRLLTTAATLLSMITLCQWLMTQRLHVTRIGPPLRQSVVHSGLTFLATCGLMLVVETFIDRYTLTLSLPGIMCLCGLMAADKTQFRLAPAWVMTGLLGLFCLIGIQDGMQRSRAFWSTIDEVHRRGVSPSYVDAGMAYAGFYRFNPNYRGPENKGPFISELSNVLSADDYSMVMAAISPATITSDLPIQVSFQQAAGYDILTTTRYESWFRSGEVYVLIRQPHDNKGLPEAIQQWVLETN